MKQPNTSKKPKWDKTVFENKKKQFKVASSISEKTRSPTVAPTKPPTKNGYRNKVVKQKRKAAKAKMKFSITVEEAKNPAMQEALEGGVAKSLGLKAGDVRIISIDGVKTSSGRRLTDVDIEFEITAASDDVDAVNQLKKDLETAATEGSIVANVQEAASDKGVLVQSLSDMALVMGKPTVEVVDTEVEVNIQEEVDVILNSAPGKFGRHSMPILTTCSVLLLTWWASQ
jgi:predicted SPOUT superfamily RNA methylase MTH1